MDTNTVQVIEKFGDKLDQYITALAAKAGVAADHFYPVFVKQQVVDGYIILVGIALAFIACVFLWRMAFKNVQAANENEGKNTVAIAKTIVGFIAGAVLTIALLAVSVKDGREAITKVLNPEYSAVQSLVQMVR